MKRSLALHCLALASLGLVTTAPSASAQEKAVVPPGAGVSITVTAAAPPPPVSITLLDRHGHVTPTAGKCQHTGGGLIDVTQPTSDVVIVTMSGAVVGDASMQFDLEQCFEVSIDDPKVKRAKLSIEGRVLGVLRGERKGCAEYSEAHAHIAACTADVIGIAVPPHSACDCQSLGVNDHDGPKVVPATPGKYTLGQTFAISAKGCWLLKHPSADFAPDPALDPLWISYFDPFHGIKKDQFGFQVIVKVLADTDDANGGKKEAEPIVAPTPEKKPEASDKAKH
jgi:hypothetical protein